ncbi:MAG TPA: histidine phosphatase family protein [Acidimicrobiales bacterium]|nr:histidine phosphatase family protein [Acidimicrobiales bacterium]
MDSALVAASVTGGAERPGDGGPDDAGAARLGTRLVIVRHGEAVCNAEEYIGGHASCRGLTKRGVRQAEALASRLARTRELDGAAAFYTSVLPRAIETAEILAPALGGVRFAESCSLCERHAGEADGLTWSQYSERYRRRSLPGDDPDTPLAPGGESWAGFVDRASSALVALVDAHPGGLVVVVAHGGVIDSSMISFLGLDGHGSAVRLHPEHASLTEWQHIGSKWRLVRYSDSAHLLAGEDGAGRDAELLSTPPPWVVAEPHPDADPAAARGPRSAGRVGCAEAPGQQA